MWECFLGEATGQLLAGWKIPVGMLPGNNSAVKEFPEQGCPLPAVGGGLSGCASPGPAAAAAGEAIPRSLRERHHTRLCTAVAAWRPKTPKSVGLHSEAFRAQDLVNRNLNEGGGEGHARKRFGPVRFSLLPLERVLQFPAGTAATARGLNHPTASASNKTEVNNHCLGNLYNVLFGIKVQRSIFSRANESQMPSSEGLNSFTEQDFQVYIPNAVSELIIFPKMKFNRVLFVDNVWINTRYFLIASKFC